MYSCIKYKHIEDLKETWEKIYRENPLLSPYQSYEFAKIVVKDYRYSHLRALLSPVFYEIKKDDQTIMIIPLWKKPKTSPPFKEYYLFPDFCLAGYLDVIYAKDCSSEDFDQALKLLKEHIKASLTLRRVNEKSLLCQYLLSKNENPDNAPCVKISFPDGYEIYNKSLRKSTRQNIRTAFNRMNRDGKSYCLEVTSEGAFEDELWQDVLRVHLKRKMVRDHIKENKISYYIHRHHDPIETALRYHPDHYLFRFKIDGTTAAYFVGFLSNDGKTVIVPRLSIDDDFDFYSPGVALITESIKYLAENTSVTAIDLCHGSQGYKYTLGGQEHTNYYFVI